MVSRIGWPSEIFGPKEEEDWALVGVSVVMSANKARKRRIGRKRPILTKGRKSRGKQIGGCGWMVRDKSIQTVCYATSGARVWLGAVLGFLASVLQTSSTLT